ncbi:hypothetical protein, partial [Duncaniella freteri]|uniref:hypothetical protein n=3 Tax=Duncaniella TaxID=2518495 RepID=UPI00256F3218
RQINQNKTDPVGQTLQGSFLFWAKGLVLFWLMGSNQPWLQGSSAPGFSNLPRIHQRYQYPRTGVLNDPTQSLTEQSMGLLPVYQSFQK